MWSFILLDLHRHAPNIECGSFPKFKYSHVSIVQESDLKERLEVLEVQRDKVTISSVDDINRYLSIELSTIKKTAIFFARKLTAATKKIINL